MRPHGAVEADATQAKEGAVMQVQEIVTTGITTVGRNDNLRMVDDLMEAGHLRHVPVLEDADLVGIVSQRDVIIPE